MSLGAVLVADPMKTEIAEQFAAMASPCEIRVLGVAPEAAHAAIALAIAEVRRIEHKYSRYRADSVISQINAAAGSSHPIAVDSETQQLIEFASQLFEASDGLFDCTSGVLRRVWDFRSHRLPEQRAIDALLPLVGWQQVQWDGERMALTRQGMELDFGGFGKEYAVDRAVAVLASTGIAHALVNLGGDVRVIGSRNDGEPWQIGIRDPRPHDSAPDQCFATIPVQHGAIATSGDYERFIEVDGKRYCHVLNPRTGWPVSSWRSVSVVGTLCVQAGALSTIAMLKGEGAQAFLDAEGVSYLLCDSRGEVFRTGA